MKSFKSNNYELKNSIFIVYIVLLFFTLLLPFYIYINGSFLENNQCLSEENVLMLDTDYEKINIRYKSISIFPEYENLACLGRNVDIEIDDNESTMLYKGYNEQLFFLIINFILFLFFSSPYFKSSFGGFYKSILAFQFIYFLIYIYFILYRYDFYGINVQKFEPSYLLAIYFLINLKIKSNDTIGILSQLVYFSLFGTKFLGVIIVYLLFQKNKDLLSNLETYKIFLYLPLMKYVFIFLSSTTKRLDFLWMSLIELPHSGFSRFYDLQWNLVSLICEKNLKFSSVIYFPELKVDPNLENSFRSCPSDLYSPIYKYLSFTFNVKIAYLLFMFISLCLISLIYIKLLKFEKTKKYFIVFLFISPPLNFLIYQGNLDIVSLIAISILLFYKTSYFWKVVIVTFVGLLELHPLAFLIGLSLNSLIKKDFRKIFINTFFVFVSAFLIWIDESVISVRNWGASVGFGYIQPDSQNISFGLTGDYQLLSYYNLNISSISALIISVIFIFGYIKPNIRTSNKNILNQISSENFYGFAVWFSVILLYENFSYRYAVFIILLYFIYSENNDSIQKIVILSVFLMPSSLVEINFVNYLTMFINKISVYTLGFMILNIFYQDLKNNLFKKEPGSSSNKI